MRYSETGHRFTVAIVSSRQPGPWSVGAHHSIMSSSDKRTGEPVLGAKQELLVGSPTVVETSSPDGRFGVVFEDDEQTGYFYARDFTVTAADISDALHIYSVEGVTSPRKFTSCGLVTARRLVLSSTVIPMPCSTSWPSEATAVTYFLSHRLTACGHTILGMTHSENFSFHDYDHAVS